MRRKTQVAMLATLALEPSRAGVGADQRRRELSQRAGAARAQANCTKVWSEIQADLVAGGGPKSELATGPTNCDHFWQSEGLIGNG